LLASPLPGKSVGATYYEQRNIYLMCMPMQALNSKITQCCSFDAPCAIPFRSCARILATPKKGGSDGKQ